MQEGRESKMNLFGCGGGGVKFNLGVTYDDHSLSQYLGASVGQTLITEACLPNNTLRGDSTRYSV